MRPPEARWSQSPGRCGPGLVVGILGAALLCPAPALAQGPALEGAESPLTADAASYYGTGWVNLSGIEGRPLGVVLDKIARSADYSIDVMDDSIRKIIVTLDIGRIFWRNALDVIAEKYDLDINESQIRHKLILIERPKLVSIDFTDTPVKQAISTVAELAGIDIIIGESIGGKVTCHIKNMPWRDVLEEIASATNCMVVPGRRGLVRVAKPSELETQMDTRLFQLQYVQAQGTEYRGKITSNVAERIAAKSESSQLSLVDVLRRIKSKEGEVVALKNTNWLFIRDTAKTLDVMSRIISQVDRPPKQVHLSMKVIELSDSDAERVGLKWENGLTASSSGVTTTSLFPYSSGTVGDAFAGKLSESDWNYSSNPRGLTSLGTLSFARLTTLMEFIRTETTGRLVQAPQLMVLDHEEATIHVGEVIRFAETYSTTAENNVTTTGYREARGSPVTLGIQVVFIPHVTGPDNNVIITVVPKTEQASGAQLFEVFEGGNMGQLKLPRTRQRTVVTTMMLRDRETGIIAGLRQQSTGETITKVPFLGDIPIVGWLFRHRSRPAETNQNTHLLMLITPTVIDFERKSETGDMTARALKELGQGFYLEEEQTPTAPAAGEAGPTPLPEY